MEEFFKRYQYAIFGGAVGLILAILLLTIGFFKTLLVFICTGVGAYLGLYLNAIGFFDRYKHR